MFGSSNLIYANNIKEEQELKDVVAICVDGNVFEKLEEDLGSDNLDELLKEVSDVYLYESNSNNIDERISEIDNSELIIDNSDILLNNEMISPRAAADKALYKLDYFVCNWGVGGITKYQVTLNGHTSSVNNSAVTSIKAPLYSGKDWGRTAWVEKGKGRISVKRYKYPEVGMTWIATPRGIVRAM